MIRIIQLINQSRFSDAEKEIKKVLSEEPNNAYNIYLLAIVKYECGIHQEALQLISNAINIESNEASFFELKARILLQENEISEAQKHASKALYISPDETSIYALLGSIHLINKEYKQALTRIEEGLSLDSENTECLNIKSQILMKIGRKEESIDNAENVLKSDPEDPYSLANYGWVLLEKGENKKALSIFKNALKINPHLEVAKTGMMESLKAKFIVYRWLLAYSFWMSKQSSKIQWGVIIGFYIGTKYLGKLMQENPEYHSFIIPLYILLIVFAISTWIISPLTEFALCSNSYGKYLLTKEERTRAYYIGGSFTLFVSGIILFLTTGNINFCSLIVFGLSYMIPLSQIFNGFGWKGKVLNLLPIYFLLVGILSIGITFTNDILINGISSVYLFSLFGYQFLANFLTGK